MAYRGNKRRKEDDDFIDDDSESEMGATRKKALKNKDSDNSDSETEATRKKAPNKKKDSGKTQDGITVCELSKNRKVTVRSFKSMILIDIREFYGTDDDPRPSKKGISLSLDQWKLLRDHVDDIDGAIAGLNE